MIFHKIEEEFYRQYQVGESIREEYFELLPIMVVLAGSMRLNTQSYYCGVDDNSTKMNVSNW